MADDKKKNTDVEEVEDDDEDVLTLEFDDGTAVDAEVIGVFDANDKEYIALAPMDGTDDVYIYGYKDNDDDTFELIEVEDEKEFESAVKVFDELMEVDED